MPHKRATPSAFSNAKVLRRNLTPSERKLWVHLRDHQLNGLGFRRQHALGPFIVDFCCPERRTTIELDGHSHDNQIEYDQERTQWLSEHGWRELRFTNRDIEQNIEAVIQTIADMLPPD